MGEAKRRRQAAGGSGNEPPAMKGEIDGQLLMRIGAVSIPHMKAMRDAVVAAFPDDDPDRIYALALGFQLDTLLGALKRPCAGIDNRKLAVDELNTWLAGVCDYRLTSGKSTSFETDMVMIGERMDRIDETFGPHMHAMNRAVNAAFPDRVRIIY